MILQEIYENTLKEMAKVTLAANGGVPGTLSIESYAARIKGSFSHTSTSLLANANLDIRPRSFYTTEQVNQVTWYLWQDLINAKKSLLILEDKVESMFSKWTALYKERYALLSKRNDELTNQLLLRRDSGGYFKIIEERFISNDNVELDSTTLLADTDLNLCHLNFASGTTRNLIDDRCSVEVNGRAGALYLLRTVPGTSIRNILTDSNDGYVCIVSQPNPGILNIAIDIRMMDSASVSRVMIKREFPEGLGTCRVELSNDQVNYQVFGVEQSISNSLVFIDEPVYAKYIRIFLTKRSHDYYDPESGYCYSFDIRQVKAEGSSVYETTGEIVKTYPLSQSVNRVLLEACSVTSDSTSIDYYLAGEDGVYKSIVDSNQDRVAGTNIVKFSINRKRDNRRDPSKIVNTVDATGLVVPTSLPETLFMIEGEDDYIVNHYVSGRSIRDVYYDYQESNSLLGGWVQEGETLSTWIFNEIDRDLDLGPSGLNIDGIFRSGLTRISVGVHKIECNVIQYSSVSETISQESTLIDEDLLYPYNAKYLIEGYPYPLAFTGEKRYPKLFNRAARRLSKCSSYSQFLLDRANSYYIIDVADRDEKAVAVYSPSSTKKVLIESDSEEGTSTLMLKAVMKTTDNKISPVLYSYRLKLGN